jgi:hypothetical protein
MMPQVSGEGFDVVAGDRVEAVPAEGRQDVRVEHGPVLGQRGG